MCLRLCQLCDFASLFALAAGYIFGGNERKESVAMTSPVRTERSKGGSEKIAMTSPVRTERSEGGSGAFKVSFVMPRKVRPTSD